MNIYSIENDGNFQNQIQTRESVSSSLTAQVLIPESNTSQNFHTKTQYPINRNDKLLSSPIVGSNKSKRIFYIFTAFTLFFFVICFIFMSVVTFKLLISNWKQEGQTSVNNININNNSSQLNIHRKLTQDDDPFKQFSIIDKNILIKYIMSNISRLDLNSTGDDRQLIKSPLSRSENDELPSPSSSLFERNLLNWLKNTFKMTFLGKYSPNENGKLRSENDDSNFQNLPYSKKSPGIAECGKSQLFPHVINTRIMNGREATANSWPWAVSIGLDGPREYVPHACGGTLLNKRYVITAAHCVMKNSVYGLVGNPVRNVEKFSKVERMLRLFIGVHDRLNDISSNKIYGVEKITIHKDFDTTTFKNDLALIRLDRDVDEMDGKVGYVCLSNTAQVHPGDTIYAIGWGYTEKSRNQASRYLMEVDLTVQHRDNCLIQYIDNDQFCAGNVYKRKDTCNGDSGGPLLKLVNNRWTLMGVVSNGDVSCSGTGIYINVPFFYDWIQSNTAS